MFISIMYKNTCTDFTQQTSQIGKKLEKKPQTKVYK